MNKFEPNQDQIMDKRERCSICDVILPSHRKWCVTPVIEGERTQETLEIEGTQSTILAEVNNG